MISYSRASEYAESLMLREPSFLEDVRSATAAELIHDDMLSGPVVGAFLNMLVKLSGARTVLEIGTFTGYATLWMAMALPPAGKVFTCEANEKYAGIARRHFERFRKEWWERHPDNSDGPPEISLLSGPALEARLPDEADFIFLDADKEHYPDYYKLLLPLLVRGGTMVIDNAFWGGSVWEQSDTAGEAAGNAGGGTSKAEYDRKALAIDRLNHMIATDSMVDNVILSVRDGLHLVRKIV